MTRLLTLCLAAALPLAAQFRDLSTDHGGERVWFSSSLALRGASQHDRAKIFVADASGDVQLSVEQPLDDPYHLLRRPQISAHGR